MPATRAPYPLRRSHAILPWVVSAVTFGAVAMALSLTGVSLFGLPAGSLVVCLMFAGVIAGADLLQPRFDGILTNSPMGVAAVLALCMTSVLPFGVTLVLTVGDKVAVVTVATVLAAIMRFSHSAAVTRTEVTVEVGARLLMTVVAAFIFSGTFAGPTSLAQTAQTWDGWQELLLLFVVAWLVLSVEIPLAALGFSASPNAPGRATGEQVARQVTMTAAVAVTAAMVALCLPVMGLIAIPIALLPLGLFQIMARRHAELHIMQRQSIHSLSRVPEAVGFVAEGHAGRVAHLSVAIGSDLSMTEAELDVLEIAALLHDLGQVELRWPLPDGATVQAAPADQQRIASDGATIMRNARVLSQAPDVVEHQCAPYHRVVERQEDLSMSSRIIKVVNAYDDFYTQHRRVAFSHQSPRAAAMERLYLGLGYEYDPKVVAALERALARED